MTLLTFLLLLVLLLALASHLRYLIHADGYGHRPPPRSHHIDTGAHAAH